MTHWDIGVVAAQHQLEILGAFAPTPEDLAPDGAKAIVLLGPREPGFWAHFTQCPEYKDGEPDPLDRWSNRVIDDIAHQVRGTALYPFGGPPYQPFIRWAMRSGAAWQSPAGPLVHKTAGMMVSYRGALSLPYALEPLPPEACPCDSCADRPCLSACPVGALSAETGYDLAACHGYLDQGPDCMSQGCRARRACPVSQAYGRRPTQSAFHMQAFHPCR